MAWFIQNYAGLFPVSRLINTFVKTPAASQVELVNAAAVTDDAGWYRLSGDVRLLV